MMGRFFPIGCDIIKKMYQRGNTTDITRLYELALRKDGNNYE